jgi:hypothetical protein
VPFLIATPDDSIVYRPTIRIGNDLSGYGVPLLPLPTPRLTVSVTTVAEARTNISVTT